MAKCFRCEATAPMAELPPGASHQLCMSCNYSINEWFWTEITGDVTERLQNEMSPNGYTKGETNE